jgi:hypothetical protein
VALYRPRLLANTAIIQTVSLYAFILSGFFFFGLQGALWGLVFSHFCPVPLIIACQIRHRLLNPRTELLVLFAWPVGMAAGVAFNATVKYIFPQMA